MANGTVNAIDQLKVILGDKAAGARAQDTRLILLESRRVVQGFSGGPVVTDNGELRLVGMIQGGDPSDPDKSWAIPSRILQDSIQQFNNATNFPPSPWPTPLIDKEHFSFSKRSIKLDLLLSQSELAVLRDPIPGPKWWMEGSAQLSKDGMLIFSSKAVIEQSQFAQVKEKSDFRGTIGVAFFDHNKDFLWGTKLCARIGSIGGGPR